MIVKSAENHHQGLYVKNVMKVFTFLNQVVHARHVSKMIILVRNVLNFNT